jgi:ATP-dependent helicase/nuclease subunit A
MSETKWTKEQLQAIETKDCNLLVSAGAGSGKTAVLVARIINKVINDKVDINKLLVVTFTNAAASEMRERIAESLYKELSSNPGLQSQIYLLNKANIMTIHSFCLEIIRDNFFKVDLDPNFRISDDTERELLKIETIDELLEEKYESQDNSFVELVNTYTNNKNDDELKQLVLKIFEFVQSTPYTKDWLNQKSEMYNISDMTDFINTPWGEILVKYAKQEIEGNISELKQLYEELRNVEDSENYLITIQDDINHLEFLQKNCYSWDSLYRAMSDFDFCTLKQAKKVPVEISEEVKSIRRKMRESIRDYLRDNIFVSSSKEIFDDMNIAYKYLSNISDLVIEFEERFSKKKREKNIIDFGDIEHLCLKILNENQDIAEYYKNKFEEILIDEYQDSNLIQETIINKIAKGKTFMVGDVKQSIYRFRQARPELFLEKYYSYDLPSELKKNNYKILLSKNFRSNKNIIDSVNFVFNQIMSREVGEVNYNIDEFLKFGAEYYGDSSRSTELHIIEKQANIDSQDAEQENDVIDDIEDKPQIEARVVGSRIIDLINNYDVYDKETKMTRKAQYKDVVILMRATSGYIESFIKELSIKNIPVYADSNSGYFENAEIQIVTSLLKIIDNPIQDIPLLTVLRSQIGGFEIDELTQIRLIDRNSDYYTALQKIAGQGIEKLSDKVNRFLNKLNDYREMAKYLSISDLLWHIYNDTGYYYYVSLLPDGVKRQANLDLLLERTQNFEKTSYKGLFNFLRFIDNLKDSSGDYGSSKTIGENENVVRIMSIHKSKGLEFPIVFLCGTGKKFNIRDLSESIILHQDLGFGLDIIKPEKRLVYPCITKLALKQKSKIELLSEEMRILYVAMTRAKEKLIITGMTRDISKQYDKACKDITDYSLLKAQSFLDWIFQCINNRENSWNIKEWKYDEVLLLNDNSEKNNYMTLFENLNNYIHDKELYNKISEKLSWNYPYQEATTLPTKLTVTEIKRLNDVLDNDAQILTPVEKPKFMSSIKLSGADYGTTLHNIMQRINFELAEDQIIENLNNDEKAFIPKLIEFFKSDIYKRIKGCSEMHKEIPFNLNVPAKQIYSINSDEEIMIQGMIDLYFVENGSAVLLDYKTDNITNEQELKDKYKVQLYYYKLAIETITGLLVKEVYIYSFKIGKALRVDL